MTLKATIAIPVGASIADAKSMVEFLHGLGYPELDIRAEVIRYELPVPERGDTEVPTWAIAAAMAEVRPCASCDTRPDADDVYAIVRAAVGVIERWGEVETQLRAYGWDVPEVEVA